MGYDDEGKFTGVPQAWGETLPQSEIATSSKPLPAVIAPSKNDLAFMQAKSPATSKSGGSTPAKPTRKAPTTPLPSKPQYEPQHETFQHGVNMGYDSQGKFTGVPKAWSDTLPESETFETKSLPSVIAPSKLDIDFIKNPKANEKIKAGLDVLAGLSGLGSQIVGSAFHNEGSPGESKKKPSEDEVDWGDDEPAMTPQLLQKNLREKLKRAEGGVQLPSHGLVRGYTHDARGHC